MRGVTDSSNYVRHFARKLGTGKVVLFTENWTEIGLHPTNPIDTYATAWRTELFTNFKLSKPAKSRRCCSSSKL